VKPIVDLPGGKYWKSFILSFGDSANKLTIVGLNFQGMIPAEPLLWSSLTKQTIT